MRRPVLCEIPGRKWQKLFPYALEALENTHKIAQRCHVEIEFGVTKLPRFDVPDGLTSWEYLNKLCFEGLEERYQPVTEELKARLNYELSTIKNMGYVDYFLIVWDFIKYARDHDIMVGPGRGSAAGSLVAYTLGITQLDPIRYDLLFERFLNPERVSMLILTLTSASKEGRRLLNMSAVNMGMIVWFRSLLLVRWQPVV